eukprot:scpid36063/ scgid5288/ 
MVCRMLCINVMVLLAVSTVCWGNNRTFISEHCYPHEQLLNRKYSSNEDTFYVFRTKVSQSTWAISYGLEYSVLYQFYEGCPLQLSKVRVWYVGTCTINVTLTEMKFGTQHMRSLVAYTNSSSGEKQLQIKEKIRFVSEDGVRVDVRRTNARDYCQIESNGLGEPRVAVMLVGVNSTSQPLTTLSREYRASPTTRSSELGTTAMQDTQRSLLIIIVAASLAGIITIAIIICTACYALKRRKRDTKDRKQPANAMRYVNTNQCTSNHCDQDNHYDVQPYHVSAVQSQHVQAQQQTVNTCVQDGEYTPMASNRDCGTVAHDSGYYYTMKASNHHYEVSEGDHVPRKKETG